MIIKAVRKTLLPKRKACPKCGIEKPLEAFPIRKDRSIGRGSRCKYCRNEWRKFNQDRINKYNREWKYQAGIHRGPMSENKTCSQYLGIHIAERVLNNFFNHIERMPNGNKGFDYICGRGFTIDVKSACLKKIKGYDRYAWPYNIGRNKLPDYFLLSAFDDRDSLTPLHIWLVPGETINERMGIAIYNSEEGLANWSKYERPINKVIENCENLRRE